MYSITDKKNVEEDEDDEESANEDLVRTVAEKSNVVTFFCEY